jgi:hypothetical protein
LKNLKKHIVFLFLLLPLLSFSQKVSNIHFGQRKQKIYIYYDLQGGQSQYDIRIYCKYTNEKSWGRPLRMVSGDVGQHRSPGKGKVIIWDVLSERDKLKGDIAFKIEARASYKIYTSTFLPVFLPGARIRHYPGGITVGILKAVAVYGLIGSSILFKQASNRQYDLYHKATTQEDMDKYYNSANTHYQAFQGTLYSGITIWALDLLFKGIKGFKPDNNKISMGFNPEVNSMYLTYIHRF